MSMRFLLVLKIIYDINYILSIDRTLSTSVSGDSFASPHFSLSTLLTYASQPAKRPRSIVNYKSGKQNCNLKRFSRRQTKKKKRARDGGKNFLAKCILIGRKICNAGHRTEPSARRLSDKEFKLMHILLTAL